MLDRKALNEACFGQPHWRLAAQGFDVWKRENLNGIQRNGGIRNPLKDYPNVREYYYRFTSSTRERDVQLGGPWWISFDTFNTIKHYATRNDLNFVYAARLFLAVPHEWSKIDRIIRARLAKPVGAYMGEGDVAATKDGNWTPVQHIKVTQMYVPGLTSTVGQLSKRDPGWRAGLAAPRDTSRLYELVWDDVTFLYAHNLAPV